jgi:hypothetical protein
MTSPESSHTKNVTNELSFLLVTHMTDFGIRFSRYGNLKLCFSSGHAMDRLKYRCLVRFLGRKMVRLARVEIQLLKGIKSAF